MRLTLRQLSLYLNHIPTIMAKEALTAAQVASTPHMDEESRLNVLTDWSVVAGTLPPEPESVERISFDDFSREIKQPIV
jgi:hypothetical protein